ncbi:hypothetical protein RASY3_14675 [Ruminococcus albus SY3]|uniref:Uncharacterized protein n=1 Tax=Ruminococcus albus SY3 TaxID=1341156 RepID=A0A011UD69_RUMAL|nr:hypothetical protein [Ruminococcus albus]EXM38554.1 hypothetical protein RASY3_14675 [Ruminococcus albus SY3]
MDKIELHRALTRVLTARTPRDCASDLELLRDYIEKSEPDNGWVIDKLEDKLDQAYSDAVNDAQDYWNPNVAQDALQDAYDNVRSWIYEILNGREED